MINYEADGIVVKWTGTPSLSSLQPNTTSKSSSSSKSAKSSRSKRKSPSAKTSSDFKGTVAERKAPARIQETKVRMEGMEKRIVDWKKVSASFVLCAQVVAVSVGGEG